MNEQSIFLAALEIEDLQEREQYLRDVCGDDEALREQVEALFSAHEQSGEFLDSPALQQMMKGQSSDATTVDLHAAQREINLSFLEPSETPDSLGRLGRYEIREVIGRGGCGIVFRAFDDQLERIVAIKVMAPELATTSPARKRFLREARATAMIRHENVVSIYDIYGEPLPFLVMEFIDGETLQAMIDRTGPLDVSEVLRIGQQIACGLAAAHDKGLIHRDIKPANILIDRATGLLKITDFGLARSADDASMTQSGVITGTPLYMSPEQAQSNSIDHRSDLFSLGSVLYYMCCGRPPFRAESTLAVLKRVVEDQPRAITEIIPEVPPCLTTLISRLHAKTPEKRLASIHEVHDELERCAKGKPRQIVSRNPIRSGKRRGTIAVAVLLVVLMGLGIITFQGSFSRMFSADEPLAVKPAAPALKPTEETYQPRYANDPPRDYDSFATGTWEPLLSTREDFDLHMAALAGTDYASKAKFSEGTIDCDSAYVRFPDMQAKNFILRTRVKNAGGKRHVNLRVLHGDTSYVVFWNSRNKDLKYFGIGAAPASGWRDLRTGYYPDELPEFIEFTLASINNRFIVYIQGRMFLDVNLLNQDDKKMMVGFGGTGSRGIFKDIEFMRLPDNAKWAVPKTDDPELRAAYSALSKRGRLRVNNTDQLITRIANLPPSPFSITSVSFINHDHLIDSDLDEFDNCQNIEVLQLHNLAQITGAGLSHFRNCRNLRVLDVNVSPKVGSGLETFSECKNLEEIQLWQVPVTLEQFRPLADKPFKLMNMGGTPINDEWLPHLNLDRLENIAFSFTKVSDPGVDHLAQNAPNLKLLGLKSTPITDAALTRISELKHLEGLGLDQTAITDEGLKFLKQCSSLKQLDLTKTKVTPEGVKELKKSLPGCKILWDGGTLEPVDKEGGDKVTAPIP
ncbi:protein kinase [Gimesia chilikensis]|uniref:protein kinase domain-containing protein n=1 Tax=Gimesia chilikensis TaxID=2605989 RepID=UPI0011EC8973|nr:protein kinase [Gimesia chilikensis]KAA0137013.1 protein kinase [Gimesia chilikensis]